VSGTDRRDVVAYLRWLADQPDGIDHRQVLFRAALIITRDGNTEREERYGPQTRKV